MYIDGNHSYEYVKSDLNDYYDLLSDNGVIAGDDIHWSGVAQAVVEFAVENSLQPHFEKHSSDWYFIKNKQTDPTIDYKHTPENVYKTLYGR